MDEAAAKWMDEILLVGWQTIDCTGRRKVTTDNNKNNNDHRQYFRTANIHSVFLIFKFLLIYFNKLKKKTLSKIYLKLSFLYNQQQKLAE